MHKEKIDEKVDMYKEIKNETTLQILFGWEEVFKASLFAVILDVTPVYQLESLKHALKLKIIDESFNATVY